MRELLTKHVRIVAFLGVCIVGISFFASTSSVSATLSYDAAWDDQVDHWEDVIKREGAADAYAEFAGYVSSQSVGWQHEAAHAFGSALFAVAGSDGITTCDMRFSFGCFHQFLGDAIQALGLESIPDLNSRCFDALSESPLSCQHGIGHGTLAAIGYDDDALMQALAICRGLPGTDPIGGCYSGVFMEYNMRTMLAEAAETRPYDGNALAPCDAVDDIYRPACFYWQPQWWRYGVFGDRNSSDAFTEMGALCNLHATTSALRRACFEGIGNIVEQESGFDPAIASALCDAVSSRSSDVLFCRSMGANHFGIDVGKATGAQMCEGLTGADSDYCLAYARNEANILFVREAP